PDARKKVLILGSGPNRIGQGVEFDYCCVQASFALREAGFESIMVNCNPETVSTDYDTSDRLYFEPLTLEDVVEIARREKPMGAIVQFGGQTPLKLAQGLLENGIPILGTDVDAIEAAEDRERFARVVEEVKLLQPENGVARSTEEALATARRIGYPVMVRPSFVLGGRAMEVVHDDEGMVHYSTEAVQASEERPFVGKATGIQWGKVAALCTVGKTLAQQGITKTFVPKHLSVKEAVFPFHRFSRADTILGPEMRSTGEVMGLDDSFARAFAKAQI